MVDLNAYLPRRATAVLGPTTLGELRPRQANQVRGRALDGRRRSRRVAAAVTSVVLSALILRCSASGDRHHSAAPPSPTTSGSQPAPGLLTLAAHPLLTEEQGEPARPGAATVPLSACVSSPLTWGAPVTDAATYGRPSQARFGNEFVLRFNSVAAAHSAVTHAWRQFRDCPTPPTVVTDPWDSPLPGLGLGSGLGESFANQRARFATPRDTRLVRNNVQPVAVYSLRVARLQNVVVVVETKDVDDRADVILSVAIAKATGDRKRERAILSAVGGLAGW